MKKHLFLLLMLSLAIFSCSDSSDPIPVDDPKPIVDDPAITLTETKADFTNEGGMKTI